MTGNLIINDGQPGELNAEQNGINCRRSIKQFAYNGVPNFTIIADRSGILKKAASHL